MRRTLSAIVTLLLLPTLGAAHADTVKPSPGTLTFTTSDALVPVLDGPTVQAPGALDRQQGDSGRHFQQ